MTNLQRFFTDANGCEIDYVRRYCVEKEHRQRVKEQIRSDCEEVMPQDHLRWNLFRVFFAQLFEVVCETINRINVIVICLKKISYLLQVIGLSGVQT